MAEIRDVEGKAERLKENPVVARLASAGHVVNGIVHLLIGGIAIGVAAGAGGSADNSGAMQAIRSTPLGAVALWVGAVALFALALYCLLAAVAEARSDAKKAAKEAAKGIGHAAVGVVALTYALGGSSDSDESSQGLSATLLGSTWGAVLLFVVGAAVLAVGIGLIVSGIKQSFMDEVDLQGRARRAVARLGTVGYVAKGVAIGIVGVLFIVAVLRRNPDEAGGIDEALKSLVGLPFGAVLLVLVGVGLMLYGIFCLARARTLARG